MDQRSRFLPQIEFFPIAKIKVVINIVEMVLIKKKNIQNAMYLSFR